MCSRTPREPDSVSPVHSHAKKSADLIWLGSGLHAPVGAQRRACAGHSRTAGARLFTVRLCVRAGSIECASHKLWTVLSARSQDVVVSLPDPARARDRPADTRSMSRAPAPRRAIRPRARLIWTSTGGADDRLVRGGGPAGRRVTRASGAAGGGGADWSVPGDMSRGTCEAARRGGVRLALGTAAITARRGRGGAAATGTAARRAGW